MRNFTRSGRTAVIGGVAATMLAAGIPFATMSQASAGRSSSGGVEKEGRCSDGRSRFNFEVEREDGGFKADFEVRKARPGQQWRVKLFHDGNRFYNEVRTTNGDGEIEVERRRPNTSGQDRFRARARNLGTGELCSVTIVRR
jgi:hypothetical protein